MTVEGTARVLVAGVGNVFLGDDGFGVEVVRRMDPGELPPGVDVADYGIRGVHLAYELLDGRYGTLVLVDALPMGEPPGTLAVLAADAGDVARPDPANGFAAPTVEAHSMNPAVVLSALRALGGTIPRVLVVGCQPAAFDQGMRLTPAVAAAVDEAVRVVTGLVAAELDGSVDARASTEAR